jgi:hypothetical protein
MGSFLSAGAVAAARRLQRADIVIGIPSYQNVRTIAPVVEASQAGLAKYFPQYTAVIIDSDAGSTDGTVDEALAARVEDAHLLLLAHPLSPVHRLSVPYHGIPGKDSALRLIFGMASLLGARACVVVDAGLDSITPEWIDLLLRPVLHADFDLVAPYYHRHKYDGTITNSIVYPLTRALYGLRLRQPVGADFGISSRMFRRYLRRGDWFTGVTRFGIDVWMTTIAIAEGFRVCQSFLGENRRLAPAPGADLGAMLFQVVGSIFGLMEEYEPVWCNRRGSEAVELFGFPFDVGLDPVSVDVERMLARFRHDCAELDEIWSVALQPETNEAVRELASRPAERRFRLEDELWVRIVCDFACAYRSRTLDRSHLLRSLTPLYLARVASFVLETESLFPDGVEARIEDLCRCFEEAKPYLIANWTGRKPAPLGPPESRPVAAEEQLEGAR